ncbi:DUF396-domain-containing protein [Schizophyllum commune]
MGLLYIAVLAAFGFVTLSLASGLLYVSELIEEHSRTAKTIGQRGIYAIILLHILLYLTDSLPFWRTIFSIVCHIVYLQNFSADWPLISLASPSFVLSCILVIADHFIWFFYFAQMSAAARHSRYRKDPRAPEFTEVATFFGLCVWLAPLFLFLSLSANDNALPTRSAVQPDAPPPAVARTSLFRSMFGFVRGRGSRRDATGIIAPPTPRTPTSPFTGYGSPNLSGRRSPNPDVLLSPTVGYGSPQPDSFKLSTPPRRSLQNMRANTIDEGSPVLRSSAKSRPSVRRMASAMNMNGDDS